MHNIANPFNEMTIYKILSNENEWRKPYGSLDGDETHNYNISGYEE